MPLDGLLGRILSRGIEQSKGAGVNYTRPLKSTLNLSTDNNDITLEDIDSRHLGKVTIQGCVHAPVFAIRRTITSSDGAVLQLVAGTLFAFQVLEVRIGVTAATASGNVQLFSEAGLLNEQSGLLAAATADTVAEEKFVTPIDIGVGGNLFANRTGSTPTDIECNLTLVCVRS